jgi:hypothetical protein
MRGNREGEEAGDKDGDKGRDGDAIGDVSKTLDDKTDTEVFPGDDDDVYLDKLQTRGVEKSIFYM